MDIEEDPEIANGWMARVHLNGLSEDNGYQVRKLTLQTWHQKNDEKSEGGESRRTEVEYYLFPEWPDCDTPDPKHLIHLIKTLSETRSGTTAAPLIVHCYAGLGRTGALITLYDLLTTRVYSSVYSGEYLYSSDEDLIFTTVDKIRQQRKGLVQNVRQFTFIYELLLWQWELQGKNSNHSSACRTVKHE